MRFPRKIFKAFGTIVFFGFLFLFLLECALQLGHFILRERAVSTPYAKGEKFRILMLGESVTRKWFETEYSYPSFAEKFLNRKCAGQFEVINGGRAGIRSRHVLENFRDFSRAYRPHLTTVMMGINDHFREDLESGFIGKIRLVKLYHWIRDAIDKFFFADADRIEYHAIFAQPVLYDRGIEGAIAAHKRVLANNPGHRWAKLELGDLYRQLKNFAESEAIYRALLKDAPDDPWFTLMFSVTLREAGKVDEQKKLLLDYLKRYPERRLFKDRFLSLLDPDYRPPPLLPDYLPHTKENYRKLAAEARERGTELLLLQYPLRSARPLEHIARPLGLRLFSSEAIFQNALARKPYFHWFTDRFGGDFGHLTNEGNELFGKALAEYIFTELLKGKCPAEASFAIHSSRR